MIVPSLGFFRPPTSPPPWFVFVCVQEFVKTACVASFSISNLSRGFLLAANLTPEPNLSDVSTVIFFAQA